MKKIPLSGKYGHGLSTLVDDEDYDKLIKHTWSVSTKGYVVTTISDKTKKSGKFTLSMHRFVVNAPNDMQVDHKHGNRLDNRKSELRICTPVQNSRNRKVNHTSLSGYKGAWWSKSNKKWLSFIRLNNKRKYLGFFGTAEEAALAYNKATIKHFGEFARLNDIKSND